MKNRLYAAWDTLRASYWFIPTLMAVTAFAVFLVTVNLDVRYGAEFTRYTSWLFQNVPDSARLIFSTIASAVMTVIGVVFSLTMVVLTLTSQQYGPLIVTNFMRDRGNQFTLGTFTATFIYSLLILRTIRGSVTEGFFIPHISSLVGFGFALASLAILIYFIHHVSMSIQSTEILANISDTLLATIEDVFPQAVGTSASRLHIPESDLPANFRDQSQLVRSSYTGYVDYVDTEALFDLTEKHDILLELRYRPGQFVNAGSVLGVVYPLERATEELTAAIQATYIVGNRRTPAQDVEFLIDQLVSIATRAMSPAVNDPYTAQMCLDRLGEGLCKLGNRPLPSARRYDAAGNLRMVMGVVSFENAFYRAFDEIRHYAAHDLAVVMHLLNLFTVIGECVLEEHRAVILPYTEAVWRECRASLKEDIDLRRLDAAYYHTKHALKAD
ncbi:MAG: DUF2254 domain-containing protein [Chloroflexi bacterium]|nr:DUF2254 domain-containing protein [Chloroflexota bacterium]